MARHRNQRHELFAQALASGKSRAEAMVGAGYSPHRGNQNRLAQLPDVIARVEEIRKYSEQIVDLRKVDRGRLLIELARIACADAPLRAAIVTHGPDALDPDQPVLLVTIRLDGVLAKPIEMRLLDDRGLLSALMLPRRAGSSAEAGFQSGHSGRPRRSRAGAPQAAGGS